MCRRTDGFPKNTRTTGTSERKEVGSAVVLEIRNGTLTTPPQDIFGACAIEPLKPLVNEGM